MPPAGSRMLTPEMVSATANDSCVTWRAQPPFWMRRGALLNEAQLSGMLPTSVGGGENARKLIPDRRILRPGIADAPRILCADRTLPRIVPDAGTDIAPQPGRLRPGH